MKIVSVNVGMPRAIVWKGVTVQTGIFKQPEDAGQIDAVGPINGFIADGLFIGQPKEFSQLLLHLAREADEAKREL